MLRILLLFCVGVLAACASGKSSGHTRTQSVLYLDEHTYLLLKSSDDPSYAFEPSNPVKVGSKDGGGPLNERRFLNALLGPNGEKVFYFRAGSCCPFKTPNGLFDNSGMLDRYRISWTGARDTLDVYINMYDEGDLFIPRGLTAKQRG